MNMVLPCRNQDIRWTDVDRQGYKSLLAGADKAVYVSDEYTSVCMLDRSRYLASNSAHCIAHQAMKGSSTAFTLNLTRKHGLSVVPIDDLR